MHDVENPFGQADQSRIDANNKVLRDCETILNEITLQTYDKLLKQLEALEIDRYERLEGMINIIFSKVKFFVLFSNQFKMIFVFFYHRLLMNQHLVFYMQNYVNNFKK